MGIQSHPGFSGQDPDLANHAPQPGIQQVPQLGAYEDYVDYTAIGEDKNVVLPDGRQWVTIRPLTEAGRVRYLKANQTAMKVTRGSDTAEIPVGDIASRKALLEAAIVGWNIMAKNRSGQWESRPFNTSVLSRWLDLVRPSIVDLIEHEIRKQNSWLIDDLTVDDIDEQIKRLEELRQSKLMSEADERNFPRGG